MVKVMLLPSTNCILHDRHSGYVPFKEVCVSSPGLHRFHRSTLGVNMEV